METPICYQYPVQDQNPVVKAVFDEADKLLGFSFSKKLFETDRTEIMDTEITQVAIFLTRVAYYRVLIEGSDILPDSYAGHSVGEYAALICSRAMRFEDGLSLISRRGQLMQKVSDDMGDGGMLAIMGMAYPEVKELTEAYVKDGTVVCISTYNDIRQMVISGRKVHFLLWLWLYLPISRRCISFVPTFYTSKVFGFPAPFGAKMARDWHKRLLKIIMLRVCSLPRQASGLVLRHSHHRKPLLYPWSHGTETMSAAQRSWESCCLADKILLPFHQ